jgi:hypothetical protein
MPGQQQQIRRVDYLIEGIRQRGEAEANQRIPQG